METLVIIFFIGFFSAIASSFVSGALSIISLSLLMLLGLPPTIAFSTFRIGTIGFDLGGFFRYFQEKKIDWGLFWPLTVTALLGTVIGAQIIVHIDQDTLSRVVGLVILLMVPILIWQKNLGVISKSVSTEKRYTGHVISFLLGIWSGSFTLGIGLFSNMQKMYFYGLDLITAKGTSKLPSLIASTVIVITFAWHNLIVWEYVAVIILGTFAGSYIGVKYSIRFGNKNLKLLLIVSMTFFGIKFLFGL